MPDVALVHDYFVQDGGGERVAIELSRLLPAAEIYTSFFDASIFGDRIDPARVHSWPLQGRVSTRDFRRLVQLYPLYFSALDLRDAHLVVSSSSAFAKAVRTSRRAIHVSYIHTPMRFAYDPAAYFSQSSFGIAARAAGQILRAPLAMWDRRTARQPDILVANSETVRQRIREHWGRDAEVIHPPVSVSEFEVSRRDDGFLLIAARLLAYRRIDVAVRAATAARRQLVIVGDGPERERLESLAGPTVRLTGWLPRTELIDLFARCHAYVVPGEEDFGIAPVEAMAAGKPVVALARGGVGESVVDGVTGVLFDDQSPAGLEQALERLDGLTLDPAAIRARAEHFDRARFFDEWRALFVRLGVDPNLYRMSVD
ncbi:MAG TPA: glycosyltransferase [Candidatus Limnocylindrales bacterium]|nr:glycosyltransferase [Candidatus Limnocylindrales bacterium]